MDWYAIYRQFLNNIKKENLICDAGCQQQLFQILEQMDNDPDFEIDWKMIEQLEKEFAN